ncbi:MAG: VanW family protein [Dehalococcoidia bacterium]
MRPYIPGEAKLLRVRLLRWLRDLRSGERFAAERREASGFPFEWSRYRRPFIDYPGQEELGEAKRHNQSLLASALNGTVIEPGECLSVWKMAGRPTRAKGYREAAALKSGELTTDVGGAICLLSTVLYNSALMAGMEIRERKCHSVDSYGDRRYFELGRDAAIEYGYTDLRFRNSHTAMMRLDVSVLPDAIECALFSTVPASFAIELAVSQPELLAGREDGWRRFRVRTRRRITREGSSHQEDLGESIYRIPAELEPDWPQL